MFDETIKPIIDKYASKSIGYKLSGAGGGGWGANGASNYTSGGAGGKAVALNAYSVTWTSNDTARVYGSVS
jgi:hypothetical protein